MSGAAQITSVEEAISVLQRAAGHLSEGRLRPAEQDLQLVLSAAPDQPDALHMMGHILCRRGDRASAIGYLERAVLGNPDDMEIRRTLADTLRLSGRARDAVSVARTALRQAPDDPALHYELGRALGEIGEAGEATDALNRVIELGGETAAIQKMIGVLHHQSGRLDDALSAYQRAQQLEPRDPETPYNIGSLHLQRRQHDEAAQAFRNTLDLAPDHVGALRSYGTMLARMDDYAASLEPLRRAIKINPDDAAVAFELIYSLAIADNPTEAVEVGEAFLRNHPEAEYIHQQMAFAYQRNGEFDKAIDAADKVLGGNMIPTTALSMKSAALNELGRREEAQYLLDLDNLVTATEKPAPEGYPSIDAFNADLVQYIENHPTLAYSPANRSMEKGRGTLELFDGSEQGPALVLKQMILDAAAAYANALPDDTNHPFIAAKPNDVIVTCWGNVYDRDGKQLVHFHPPAWLSGVYYPKLPACMKGSDPADMAGGLELGRAYFRLKSDDSPPVRIIKPTEGTMVLFPSYVGHQTIPISETDEPRVSIAFDVAPKV